MAKKIKAIKCPQCGSVKAKEIREDYYRCESCGADFFLDSDDINVSVNHTQENFSQVSPQLKTKPILITIAIVIFLFFGIIVFNLPSSTGSDSKISVKHEDQWWNKEEGFFQALDGTPILLVYGELSNGEMKNQPVALLYEASTGKKIKEEKLDVKEVNSSHCYFRIFDDGTPYFILNKSRLYTIDKKNKKIVEVTALDFPDQPLLQSGFAQIEFEYEEYGSGFKIITNNGQHLYYYPISKQLFTSDREKYKARESDFPKEAKIKQKIKYQFSREPSRSFKNEKLQLIKYVQLLADGYIRNEPIFQWDKSYYTNDKKFLITDRELRINKIVEWKDLTPNRLYFNPKLLAYTDDKVFISFNVSPAEDSATKLQLLNGNGNIKWTIDMPDNVGAKPVPVIIHEAYFSDKGIMAIGNYYAVFLDLNGKVLHQFNL